MTTNKAFEVLISKKGWYLDLGLTETVANSLVSRFRNGEEMYDSELEYVLVKAGFNVVQGKQWELHKPVMVINMDRMRVTELSRNSSMEGSSIHFELQQDVQGKYPSTAFFKVTISGPVQFFDSKKAADLANFYWELTLKSFD